jgi:hypothetical protein
MSCYICRRGSCTPSFHSLEEQEAYEDADTAYEEFLDVWERCNKEWLESEEEEPEEDED